MQHVPPKDPDDTPLSGQVIFVSAFASLGLLVGNLIGLTASSVVAGFLPLVFAFGGGSIFAFLRDVSKPDQIKAALAITGFSLFCLFGTYAGITISEHQYLTPSSLRSAAAGSVAQSVEARKYLRENVLPAAKSIDQQMRAEGLPCQVAHERLMNLLLK